MKQLFLLLISFIITFNSYSNAVAIVDATNKTVLQLISSEISAEVTNQVATVTSTQTFFNQLASPVIIKYAFPLDEDACATGLRWKINGIWHSAIFSPAPPDTTLPGGGGSGSEPDADLLSYLGETPLYFNLEDSIPLDSMIVFELTYVQLLHYAFNEVTFEHPNDYTLIQNMPLSLQTFSFHVNSDRTITGIDLVSHAATSIWYTSNEAAAATESAIQPADKNYYLTYELSPEELGLFSFSTFLPDSMNACDSLGNGFFAFIVEPDPMDSVIQKVFTLIIDRSGSMSGSKIQQAKDAATYIVNSLNTGDKFNIIDFDDQVTSLFTDHADVNLANINTALNYINQLTADGSTNISGSFQVAIPQFSNSNPDVANIIIFMTDGQANVGISGTPEILAFVQSLISTNQVEGLSINTFGIGAGANESLLAQLAEQNNGIAEFFEAGDLLQVVTNFYQTIQSPVMLNTSMSFDPPMIYETYPNPLPNLYKGHQLVAVGRYNEPGLVTVTFSGTKFGDSVSYQYVFDLTDSLIEEYLFLTKLWAIEKINHLMKEYYILDPTSTPAINLKKDIVELSLCYGVMSPFTSFTIGPGTVGIEELTSKDNQSKPQNFPNPFRTTTLIHFSVPTDLFKVVPIVILDVKGNVVRVLQVFVSNAGGYEIKWDGKDENGNLVISGVYPYYLKLGDETFYGIMEKM